MRFLLKIAFLLGLVALFLPSGGETTDGSEPGLSPIVLLYGAQQALADVSGFCDRAPAACASGQEALRFAGQRIGDGIALAYSFASARIASEPATPLDPAEVQPRPTQPSGLSPSLPRAYTPPVEASQRSSAPIATGALRTDPVTTAAVARDVPSQTRQSVSQPGEIVPPAAPARLPLPQAAPRA